MEKREFPSCFVAQIDPLLKDKLRLDLEQKGFSFSSPPYTHFCAKKDGVSCTLYQSGKLTVQGKGKEELIQFYLEPEILQNLSYSHPETAHDPSARIGMDEAGKGDFFGPLCIAAIFVDTGGISKLVQMGVKDSKQLSDATIVKIAASLRASFPFKILQLFPETYNRLYAKFHNLNRLLAWAHATILEELSLQTGCKKALLDQFAFPGLMESFLAQKKLDVVLTQKVRGEEDLVVAAASILARAAFVEGIDKLGKEVGFVLPKGASSPVLQTAKTMLQKHGIDIFQKTAKTHFKTLQDLSRD